MYTSQATISFHAIVSNFCLQKAGGSSERSSLLGAYGNRACIGSKPRIFSELEELARGFLAGPDFLPATGTAIGLQHLLAEADGFWRDLHELIVGDEFDRLLQA